MYIADKACKLPHQIKIEQKNPAKKRDFFRISLHKRGDKPQKVLGKLQEKVYLTFLGRYLLTAFEGADKVLFYLKNSIAAVKDRTAFKMQIQAAIVHICCADGCNAIVGNKGL